MATAGGRLSGATRTATTATRPGPPDARPERLDAGQLATLGAVTGEWLAAVLAVGPTDREAAEDGVRRAYQSAGLAPPERVVWLGSPQAGAVAVALPTGLDADVTAPDPRWDRVRDELEGQGQPTAPGRPGRPVRPLLGPLLWAEVRARLLQQMAPGLWERAWSATAGALLGRLPERIWYLQLEAGGPIDARLGWRATERLRNQAVSGTPEVVWCAASDGLRRVLPGLAGPERLAGLRRVTRSAGWWWPFDRLAVLTDRPAALHRDERDELHRPDGPALAYPDGFAVHAWHGRPVPGELIARLPGLRADDITAEPNLELRRIMTESYGLHRYLRDAGGRVVGQDTYGRLWRLDRPGAEPLVMVEVVNSTPEPDGSHATYWLRVPPDIRSAHAAVAWTFRLNEGTYRRWPRPEPAMGDGSWFVHRSPFEGPSATLVGRLPDRTPLAWFRRVWAATADAGRIDDRLHSHRLVAEHLAAELGTDVFDLTMLFTAGRGSNPVPGLDRAGPLPAATWEELRDLLCRCLRLEGDPDGLVQVDEHSVRVRTNDDDELPGLACCFFLDDALVRAAPDRAAYLMRGDWRLPATIGPGRSGFEAPFPVRTLLERRSGTGATWVVTLDTRGELGDAPPVAFSGVRLPELARLLRTSAPPDTRARRRFRDRWSSWPWQPLVLRALVAPGDRGIGAALGRYNHMAWNLGDEASVEALRRSAEEPWAAARTRMARFLRELPPDQRSKESWRDPGLSRIQATRHLVQGAIHMSQHLAYQRWYLFDDVWAAAHPDLAASLLRCAAGWDPFRA